MKNNKFLGMGLWGVGLLAVHLLIFCIATNFTTAIWVTYGFTLFVFFSQLILWLYLWRRPLGTKERFYYTPALLISVCHIILQTVLCLVFVLWNSASVKVAILFNALLLLVILALLILSFLSKNHIERVDHRQKDHHVEL